MLHSNHLVVLMFHKISKDKRDGLTITMDDFVKYIDFFKKKKFNFLSHNDVLKILNKEQINTNRPSVFITFDDGYEETFKLIESEYSKIKVPITCFVPVQRVGGVNSWDAQKEQLLSWASLNRLAEKNIVDFALHSYSHKNYKTLSAAEIKLDIEKCKAQWRGEKPFVPLLAYPYGSFNKQTKKETAEALSSVGIKGAFRIGNRRNQLNQLDPYFIERIDIRGDQSFFRNILKIYGIRF